MNDAKLLDTANKRTPAHSVLPRCLLQGIMQLPGQALQILWTACRQTVNAAAAAAARVGYTTSSCQLLVHVSHNLYGVGQPLQKIDKGNDLISLQGW